MKPALLCLALAAAACAQLRDNRDPQLTCDNGNYGNERQRFCEVREQTVPGVGRLSIDPVKNGGVTVRGWLRNDVLVRSRVDVWARSDAEARSLAGQVRVDVAAGQVKASGPDSRQDASWSVSYEIFAPQTTDLNLTTLNGGINIADVRGRMEVEAKNGGVRFTRVGGDVSGKTMNGGIQIELAGNTWDGRQLDARTTNGGVTISLPDNYSAHLQTDTVNGSINSDFAVAAPARGETRARTLDTNLGSGGPLIHVSTTNGGIKLKRI